MWICPKFEKELMNCVEIQKLYDSIRLSGELIRFVYTISLEEMMSVQY